ncbi:MAG: DUF1573 domain-containing protein [Isosphaeraceae bacterium]
MKRWIMLIVLVVGLSAAGTVLLQYVPGGSGEADQPLLTGTPTSVAKADLPKAVVDGELQYEFGTLPQNVTGKHSWTVHNKGKSNLELWMISSTCSCTLAKFKDGAKAVVKPGESTVIDLEYETRQNNGEYAKGAEIGTNDPDLAQFSLTVKGKVYPPVLTFPAEPTLNMGVVSNEKDQHDAFVAAFSLDRPETRILSFNSSNPMVTAEITELTPEELKSLPVKDIKRGSKLSIHVKSGLALGSFRQEVVFKTDHPKQPELRIAVGGKMVGAINLMPSGLSMHDVYSKAGATGEVSLLVMSQRETKFKVVKKPENVKAEVAPAEGATKPGRYRLLVTVPPGTPPMRIEEDVVLETDHPKASTVIVPMSIWVLDEPK